MLKNEKKDETMFSIIVPVYNAENYLEKCITSVIDQTFNDFELILIDDGSTDHSAYICDQYMKIDKRIKVFHQENAGQTFSRKKGLDKSVGEYILFLDSDDWLDEKTLEKCFCVLDKCPLDILLFGCKEKRNENEIEVPINFPEGYYNEQQIEKIILPRLLMDKNGDFFPRALWGKVFRREVIVNNLNKVPEIIRNGEDMCCVINAVLESRSLFICKDLLYFYRIESTSSLSKTGDKLALKRCKIMAIFLNETILKRESVLREQYWRLLVQQIYSAVVRTSNVIGFSDEFFFLYQELLNETLCKDAIQKAKFSRKAMKLKIKQIILKHRVFWITKYMKK